MKAEAGKIFISYRRADSTKDARALYERLRREFGDRRVFIDLEGIAPGDDFVESLQRNLDGCGVLIALIGPQWASTRGAQGGRRIDDDDDVVRIELRTALARNIKVLPVLIDGAAPLQASELPPDLQALVRRQAIALDYTRFESDVAKLVQAIRTAIQDETAPQVPQASTPAAHSTPAASHGQAQWRPYALLALAVAAGVFMIRAPEPAPTLSAPANAELDAPAAGPDPGRRASEGAPAATLPVSTTGDGNPVAPASQMLRALKAANIQNSVGDAELLAWLDDADQHYRRLAEACLALVGKAGVASGGVDLDKVNEYYSRAVGLQGDEVMPLGQQVDTGLLKAALIAAYNNKNGTQVKVFAQILAG